MYKVASGSQILFDGSDAADGKMNGFGKWQKYKLGNGIVSNITYNKWGMPTNYQAGTVQDLTLDWHLPTGNLTGRLDKGKYEVFNYDNLNRLISARVGTSAALNFDYNANGNIKTKSGVGTYNYDPNKVNAVTSITDMVTPIAVNQQDIIYTKYQRAEKITEGSFQKQHMAQFF